MNHPMVSVLMSVYNGEKHLKEAVESILNQTFTDFEFIIINDACTDSSRQIISGYKDSRIRLIDNTENLGLTKSLNKGINLARGKYIARMDCDDISLPERLAKQAVFMEANPNIGVCGTFVKTTGEKPGIIWKYPTDPEVIKCRLLFESGLAHPSVFMRREFLQKFDLFYDPQFQRTQDFELWTRCSEYFPMANLDEVLLLYRIHSEQVGTAHLDEQTRFADIVRYRQVEKFGLVIEPQESDIHCKISTGRFEVNKEFVEKAEKWLIRLLKRNEKIHLYPEAEFSQVLGEMWFRVCNGARGLGLWVWEKHRNSCLSCGKAANFVQQGKFFINSLLKRT